MIMGEQILLCDSNFCRLCAEGNENGINIFATNENSTNLQLLINKYLPIVVEEDDTFPKNICPGCHIQLEATKLFMDLIINGQSKLRAIYKKQLHQTKIVQLEQDYLNNLTNSTLYFTEHELKLRAEGVNKPKRKRGRPAKKLVLEDKQDLLEEKLEETKEVHKLLDEEEIGPDGRRKRRVKAPIRFEGLMQGKELEDILKKEGVLDDDIKVDVIKSNEHLRCSDIIIGRTEGAYGEDLGRPVFINKPKIKSRAGKIEIKKFQCDICSKIFIHEINFNLHKKSHENESENLNMSKSGDSGNNLEIQNSIECLESSETVEITIKDEDFSCLKCEETSTSRESLRVHLETHKKNRTFTCEICGKVLQHASSLLYHKDTEHNNKRFVCNKCNKSFKHRQLLQRHQIVHSDKRPFICPVCNAGFKTQANLINHEAVHTGEKRYECTECNQKFAHKTSLSLHQRWHEGLKPFTCEFCQKSFSQNGNLLEHKRIHTGEKPFFCEVCGKNFTTSSQMRIHVKRHTGEKPWKCEICQKCFLHRDTFKFHMRRHLNEKPHVCPTCNKAFTEQCALKKHERTHTGTKPYKCEHCLKAFADQSNLQKHTKIHKLATNNSKVQENVVSKPTGSFQLTQLIDQQGNPISITTQDGQTVPIVTSGDDDSNLQGLMPDGTLVPIKISSMPERDFTEEISETPSLNLIGTAPGDALILEDPLGNGTMQNLNPNFELLTNNDGEEVCLVTYSIEEDGALTQELVLEQALGKKTIVHDTQNNTRLVNRANLAISTERY